MVLITNRRKFLTGLVSLIAAPAIVRAENLMPVRALRPLFGPDDWVWIDATLENAFQMIKEAPGPTGLRAKVTGRQLAMGGLMQARVLAWDTADHAAQFFKLTADC